MGDVRILQAAVAVMMSCGSVCAQTGGAALPVVDILYPAPGGSIFDSTCAALLKTTIQAEAVREAAARVPEFQAAWNRDGAKYLSTTLAEVGLPFPYREMQATLTVCPGVKTMSSPLFVNVQQYLPSAGTDRVSDDHFVEQLYHELMHHYVRQVRDGLAMRKKYAAESQATLSHLHVLALEKFVLLKLGKAEELKRVANDYQTSTSAGYRRAWQIVNDIEGYEVFVKELKEVGRR